MIYAQESGAAQKYIAGAANIPNNVVQRQSNCPTDQMKDVVEKALRGVLGAICNKMTDFGIVDRESFEDSVREELYACRAKLFLVIQNNLPAAEQKVNMDI